MSAKAITRRQVLKSLMAAGAGCLVGTPLFSFAQKPSSNIPDDLAQFCHAIPKSELHVHLSSSIYPDVALKLAKKNNITNLSFKNIEEFYARFISSDGSKMSSEQVWGIFFKVLDEMMNTIQSPDDVVEIITAWIERSLVPSNARYVELTVSHPMFHRMNMKTADYVEGLKRAHALARDKYGIRMAFIGASYLYQGNKPGIVAAHDFAKFKDEIPLVAMTGYNESPKDANQLAPFYDVVKKYGFKAPMHVGLGEPNSLERMWSAIDGLKIDRIDHGYMAKNDPKLMDYIREKGLAMNATPIDIAGGNFDLPEGDPFQSWTWDNFAFPDLYNHGITVTVSSDVPGVAGVTLADNYLALIEHYGYKKKDVVQWAKNGFKAAFLEDHEKDKYLKEIDAWLASR